MFSDVVLNEEVTKQRFGYSVTDTTKGRHIVVVECLNCFKLIEREFRNSNRKHSCPVVEGVKKRCFKCKTWKDLSMFNKAPRLSGGVGKMCRDCHNTHPSVIASEKKRRLKMASSFETNLEFYMEKRANYLRNRLKRKNETTDIDAAYLMDLWNSQEGKYYYSGLYMKSDRKVNGFQGWFAPSLDRKIPELGYIRGNVVWCCFSVNSFKQSLSEIEFINIVNNIKWVWDDKK